MVRASQNVRPDGGAETDWSELLHNLTVDDLAQASDDAVSDLMHLARQTLRKRAEALRVTHPAWCSHKRCRVDYDAVSTHPEDWSSFHESEAVDHWLPVGARGESDLLVVLVEGTRHPSRDDWPDEVVAHGTSPGHMGGVHLEVADARRLAHALLKACDLAESDSAVPTR